MTEPGRSCIWMRADPGFRAAAFSLLVERLPAGVAGNSAQLADAVERFVSAANAGMCSGKHFSPGTSVAQATAPDRSDGALVVIECHRIDAGSVRLLANLLRKRLGSAGASVPAMVLEGLPDRSPHHSVPVEALAYPAPPPYLPFEVDLVLPDESLVPLTARLTFAAPLCDADVVSLENCMALWRGVVAGGAYAAPDAESSDLPDVDDMEVYLLCAWQVEVAIYGFVAADAAFDGLVSLLAKTQTELTVKLVSLEVW